MGMVCRFTRSRGLDSENESGTVIKMCDLG